MSVEYHNMFHLLIATTNPNKIKEVTAILKSNYLKISSLVDFPEYQDIKISETGATFAENALIKARAFGRLSGLPTLADDSGLSVTALNGQPGIYSKRFAKTDADRINKLLHALENVPAAKRQAQFICALVLYDPSSDKHYTSEGKVTGIITHEPKGHNGFGYDPVFFCPEIQLTFGEASEDTKNKVSHRSRALEQMRQIIRKRCL